MPTHLVAYVGGYGTDIGWYDVAADGTLTAISRTTAFAPSPSYLAMTRTGLFAISESNSRVGAYTIDAATGALTFINDVDSGGDGPAYVGLDHTNKFVLVANYGGGTISVHAVRSDGGLDAGTSLAVGANAHQIVVDPSNHFVFVPCLGSDYVAQFLFDAQTGALTPNSIPHFATASGAGPRHLAFTPDGTHAYLFNEKASTLTALALDASTGRLSEIQTITSRADGATGTNTGAEVWVHPGGTFVYASNRGDNNLGVFSIASDGTLAPVAHVATGTTPRDFTLDPDGSHLYVANQGSNTVVAYAIADGIPSTIGAPIAVTKPSFVGLVALPRP